MLRISELFSRIKNAHTKEGLIRGAIRDSIKKISNIDIPVESISMRSATVTLKDVNQSDRSTIFIKKQRILEDINSSQAIRKIEDIR